MKPAVPVLCVLVSVTTASAGPPAGQDTGSPRPRAAPAPRLREVRFEGDLAFEPDALKKVLKGTRQPHYEARGVEADLVRLRSFYFSHAYFDATVGVGDVNVDGREATLTLKVQSGPKYAVRRVEIDGIKREAGETATDSSGEFPVDALCTSLLDARRIAESHGSIDFAVALEVSPTDPPMPTDSDMPWVDVTARVRTGSTYVVGRIDFSGHHRINESTLRRAMALQERSLFDVGKLRGSLARLNRYGLFEPLMLQDVEVRRNPDTLTAYLTITVRERPGGRWSLSGPVGPTAFGFLQASISSRLPAWGRGVFEASTYYLTFSLMGFSNPLLRVLPLRARPSPSALLVLERPYLPGQALLSGFAISPQLSARSVLASYGLTHLKRAGEAALIGEPPDASDLLIPISGLHPRRVTGGSEEAELLICNPPTPNRWLRRAAQAADLALGAYRPF
jgi:Surface antigen variable number repeat